MKFMQVRNATAKIEYAGKKILVDPMLAEKGTYPGFKGTANSYKFNPLVDLPVSLNEILDVDAIIVTHTHPDHWDDAAKKLLPKDMLIFAQNERDRGEIRAAGFSNIRLLGGNTFLGDIALIRTSGQHGSDDAMEKMGDILGEVSGVVFKHPSGKNLYLAGDTIWNQDVENSLKKYAPDVIILNSGDAQVIGLGSIIMGKQDIYEVYKAAPQAIIIASHMEAVNHALLSREELREFLSEKGMVQRVLVPEDGDSYEF